MGWLSDGAGAIGDGQSGGLEKYELVTDLKNNVAIARKNCAKRCNHHNWRDFGFLLTSVTV